MQEVVGTFQRPLRAWDPHPRVWGKGSEIRAVNGSRCVEPVRWNWLTGTRCGLGRTRARRRCTILEQSEGSACREGCGGKMRPAGFRGCSGHGQDRAGQGL